MALGSPQSEQVDTFGERVFWCVRLFLALDLDVLLFGTAMGNLLTILNS